MRSYLPSAKARLLVLGLCACGSNSAPAASPSPSDGGTAPGDGPVGSRTCAGDAGGCLFGTARPADGFIVSPTRVTARLYRQFPSGGASPIARQIVGADLTWAFGGLAPWAHYYVEFEPGFYVDSGVATGALTRVGPLDVSASPRASVAVQVKPVQLDVFEQSAAGGPMLVQNASARLVETRPGSSTVSVLIGTTTTPMPWTALQNGSSSAYSVQFATPPPALPGYPITTTQTGLPPANWNLSADPPTFTGAIASPSAGAMVPANQDLTVTWAPQPMADYEEVELFEWQQGSWKNVFASAQPNAADVSQETIPAASIGQPGMYLLNVAFAKASCPAIADGCVHASTVANARLTAQ
jgi:hypothetical protein